MTAYADVDDLLAHADDLVARIDEEVSRVESEADQLGLLDQAANIATGALSFFGLGAGDELGLDDQAQAVQGAIEQGRRWIDEEYPKQRDEAEAAQDLAHAQRIVDASEHILELFTHTSPVNDEVSNLVQLKNDLGKTINDTITLPGYALFVAGGGIAGVALAATVAGINPRALLGGALGGLGLGALVRFGAGKLVGAFNKKLPGAS
jgi:hypothetical protein